MVVGWCLGVVEQCVYVGVGVARRWWGLGVGVWYLGEGGGRRSKGEVSIIQ